MRPSLPGSLALLVLVAAACGGSTNGGGQAPHPTGVVPSAGYATAPTAVVISGTQFFTRAKQSSGGGSATLDTQHLAWLGDVVLQDVTWVSTTELTATVPAGLPPGAYRLTVQNALGEKGTLDAAFTVLAPPSFSATLASDRATVSVGQTFHLALTVANGGEMAITDLVLGAPTLTSSDGAQATPSGTAPSAPATLAPGSSQTVTWTYVATTAGHLAATVSASGKDALSGAPLTATPPAASQITIETPPDLVAELSVPSSVAVNTDFTVTTTVTNSGGADAVEVTPSVPTVVAGSTGTASLKAGTGATPASAVVPAGQSVTFTWTFTAGAEIGPLRLSGGAAGKDANSGLTVEADAATSRRADVGNAAIVVTIANAPASALAGEAFTVVVNFSNPGNREVTTFTVTAPQVSPDPSGVTMSGPTPALEPNRSLGAGENLDQTWNVTASESGRLSIAFSALGFDEVGVGGSATVVIDITSQ